MSAPRLRLHAAWPAPLTLALALLCAPSTRAEDPGPPPGPAAGRAFVGLGSPRSTAYVGEVVSVALLVDVDRAWFEAHAVPLFQRRLDLPLRVEVPDLATPERLRPLPPGAAEAAAPAGRTLSLALNDDVVEAREEGPSPRAGLTRLRVERRYLAVEPGEARWRAPTLRFSWAERFREGLLGERVPEGAQAERVAGEGLVLRIAPLPADGRPVSWQGAVGAYRVRAEADRDRVEVGERLRLTLTLEGAGNLETLEAPLRVAPEGFHVYGVLDDRRPGRRTLVAEIAPLTASLRAIPALPFAYFDPQPPAAFREIRTDALPLDVRPAPPADGPPTPPSPPAAAPASTAVLVAAAAAGLLAAWLLWRRARRRAERASDLGKARLEAAVLALHAAAREPGSPLAAAFAEVLAARLNTAAAAVIRGDLVERLTAAGLPPGLARRASATLDALVAARYGGAPAEPTAPDDVQRLADEVLAHVPPDAHGAS